MFTGIIQSIGTVVDAAASAPSRRGGGEPHGLLVDLGELARGLQPGASVAINGACLTVAALRGSHARFDVVPESWSRTTLPGLQPGDAVNLERSLCAGDPLDGHFVQGHVEGVGVVERVDRSGGEWKLWIRTDAALLRAVVPKGSISLDGVSLTVIDVNEPRFSVALVPTTLERTTLGRRRPGERVNVETDILVRAVLHRLALRDPAGEGNPTAGVTWEGLREAGFVT